MTDLGSILPRLAERDDVTRALGRADDACLLGHGRAEGLLVDAVFAYLDGDTNSARAALDDLAARAEAFARELAAARAALTAKH